MRPDSDSEKDSRELDHADVRAALVGDAQAFERLVHRHEARAFRVAKNLVGSEEDARDVAQEAFLRVFRSLSAFDFDHAFSTWLYRIVTNLAIDHLRRRRPQWSTSPIDEDQGEVQLADPRLATPHEDLERLELSGEVRACMEALAPHFQSVLVLREIEGLGCGEIAEIVGATHVTVRWRLHRGRKLFQEEWERRARLRERTGHATSSEASRTDANAQTAKTPDRKLHEHKSTDCRPRDGEPLRGDGS